MGKYIYCDCRNSKNKVDLKQAGQGRLKMSPTVVDSDGFCRYCGFVAVISEKPLEIKHADVRYRGAVKRNGVRKYLKG